MSKILQIILATVAVVQTVLLVVVLIFVVQNVDRANRLDRFYNTVSEDYRAINDGEVPTRAPGAAPAVAEAAAGPPCVDPMCSIFGTSLPRVVAMPR